MEEFQRLIDQIRAEIQEGRSDEEIFQTLRPFLNTDRQTEAVVAEFLATIPHEKIAKVLQRMLEVSKDKKVRKIIKRSLYRLRTKGILLEEVSPDRGGSILQPLKMEPKKGFGSAVDFLGQRLLMLVIPHTGRGWIVMQGVVSDTRGLVDFSGEEMNRKGFRRFFEDIEEKTPFPLVEMEPSYVGFLLDLAYRLTVEKRGTPSQDYLRLKSEIEAVKKKYEQPLAYSYLPSEEIAGDDRLLIRAADLLKSDLLSGWRIEEDQIRPYADAVWETEGSKIILNQTQKEARFQEIYMKALSELFGEEKRSLYKRRLEEMAYVFLKLEREEEAKLSLSCAIDLEKPVNPIQPSPFLFQLVIKSIFTLLAEAYEKKAKEPSLIVKP